MRFRFYSAEYADQSGLKFRNMSELEFEDLDEAAEFMRKGVITQDDLGMAFIPLICEVVEEEETE